MKKNIALGICLILVLGLSGCVSQTSEIAQSTDNVQRDIVIIGTKGGIFGFHPWMEQYETSTMSVNFNIFNSLVEFDKNYRIIPALAERWENPDNLTWRFYLRQGVKFHNGNNFTAEDAKYTIDLLRTQEGSVLKDLLSAIDSVTVVDKYIIDVKTKEPFPILLNKLVDIMIVSKEYQESTDEKWPIGTGAYKLSEYVDGDHFTLESFDDYWKDVPLIKTVIFKVIENDEERENALSAKQIDIAEYVSSDNAEAISESGIDILKAESTRVIYLSFDFRENGSYAYEDGKNPTSDVRVRKAIYHAIDEDYIIKEIMGNYAVPASQFVSPSIFGYNPEIKRLEYDVEEAKRLMAEAGYEDGFEIRLDCPNNRYVNDEKICNEVGRQLSEIGITVHVNAEPKEDFFPKIDARETSFYLLGWATDTADGGEIFDYILRPYDEEKGTGSYNTGMYYNEEIDEIGETSSSTINPKERLALMQRGFKIAMDDVVWVPLHVQNLIYGKAPDIVWEPRADVKIKAEAIGFE